MPIDKSKWFLSDKEVADLGRPEPGEDPLNLAVDTTSDVLSFTDPDVYLARLYADIRAMKDTPPTEAGSYIFVSGMEIAPDVQMVAAKPESEFAVLLISLPLSVQCFLLLPTPGRAVSASYPKAYAKIPNLTDVALDTPGVHTQSTVLIYNADTKILTAYAGAFDVSAVHRQYSIFKAADGSTICGWHGMMLRLGGAAAQEIDKNFRQRWANVAAVAKKGKKPAVLPEPPGDADPAGDTPVQILRTLAYRSAKQPFAFAKEGEYTILMGWRKAITAAEKYIYLQDPYFVSLGFARLLGERMKVNTGLRVVLVLSEEPFMLSGSFLVKRRAALELLNDLLRKAGAGAADRLTVCSLREGSQPIKMATCLMLVDDTCAITGSASINRRSISLDTGLEVSVISDADSGDTVLGWRKTIWATHLGAASTGDLTADLAAWKAPGTSSRVHLLDVKTLPSSKDMDSAYEGLDPLAKAPVALFEAAPPVGLPTNTKDLIANNKAMAQNLLDGINKGTVGLTKGELRSEYTDQLHEIVQNGSFTFVVKMPGGGTPLLIPTIWAQEAIDMFQYWLDHTKEFGFLSLMRVPGGKKDTTSDRTLNHGRAWDSGGLKDSKNQVVWGLSSAADVRSFEGKLIDIKTADADLAKSTLSAVCSLLKTLPPDGTFDFGLPSPGFENKGGPNLFCPPSGGGKSGLPNGIDDLLTSAKDQFPGFTDNPQQSVKDAVAGTKYRIVAWYPDAFNHMHVTAFVKGVKSDVKKTDWRKETLDVFAKNKVTWKVKGTPWLAWTSAPTTAEIDIKTTPKK